MHDLLIFDRSQYQMMPSPIYIDDNTSNDLMIEYDENSRISQWLDEEEALLNESDLPRSTISPLCTTGQHERLFTAYPTNNNNNLNNMSTTDRTPLQVMDVHFIPYFYARLIYIYKRWSEGEKRKR